MSDIRLLALSPYIVLLATAVLVMLVSTFSRSHGLSMGLTEAGLAGALACVVAVASSTDRRATSLLRLDDFALYFVGLLVVVTIAVTALSYGYLERTERRRADFYTLILFATLGAAVLVASTHFASFFLGLEILTVSLYGLIAYPGRRLQAAEAGFKYLVLAGTTSALLVLGMAFAYAVSGTMSFTGLASAGAGLSGWESMSYYVGLVLIFTGVGFKLALVPFHLWTPDVYQGGPAPVTAFLASVSKAAVFVVLLQFLAPLDLRAGGVLFVVFTIVGYASMLVGNLLALFQQNIKRLLGYSSIANLGYLMVALIATRATATGRVAAAFYLSVYSLALVAAFGVVAVVSYGKEEAESLTEYRGLGHRRPLPALVLTISMLSLAGIPLTAGFIGKFYIFQAGAGASLWGLLIVLALSSAMSLYYYLRVIISMFRVGPVPLEPAVGYARRSPDRLAGVAIAILSILIILLGVYPSPLLRLIESVTAAIG
jgi:NADH-quinone oxidoreductase subunit N